MPPQSCDHRQPPEQADRAAAGRDEPQPRSPGGFQLVLAAAPAALSLLRDRLRKWLRAHEWPETELDDLVLAVNEAASNVVDHAYPPGISGHLEIDGRVTVVSGAARAVELTVRDHGCWRPIPELRQNRRRGIPLMKATAAEVIIDGTDRGTCVTLRGRAVGRSGGSESEPPAVRRV
ncbi:MAG: ATP-binding protein [Pseudonocardiaceae bacterium]